MRKKSETVRLKVDQRVAGDERSAVCRGMKNNLAGRGALDANDSELVTNFAAVTDFRAGERLARKCLGMREDRDGEPGSKVGSGAQMIAISHDDSADRAGVEQLSECSIGQRDWIDKKTSVASRDDGRKEVGLKRGIVSLPDQEGWGDLNEFAGNRHDGGVSLVRVMETSGRDALGAGSYGTVAAICNRTSVI